MFIHGNRRNVMRTGYTNQKCPKCSGNIFVDREYSFDGSFFIWYEQGSCLQCGYVCYPEADTASMEESKVMPAAKELAVV